MFVLLYNQVLLGGVEEQVTVRTPHRQLLIPSRNDPHHRCVASKRDDDVTGVTTN